MRVRRFFENVMDRLFSRKAQPAVLTVTPNWKATLTGVITDLSSLDVDKSGRNPKLVLRGSIQLESSTLEGADFPIPNPARFSGREAEITAQAGKALAIGERVTLHSRGVDVPDDRFIIQG